MDTKPDPKDTVKGLVRLAEQVLGLVGGALPDDAALDGSLRHSRPTSRLHRRLTPDEERLVRLDYGVFEALVDFEVEAALRGAVTWAEMDGGMLAPVARETMAAVMDGLWQIFRQELDDYDSCLGLVRGQGGVWLAELAQAPQQDYVENTGEDRTPLQ